MPEDTPITPEELDAMPFEQALERLKVWWRKWRPAACRWRS